MSDQPRFTGAQVSWMLATAYELGRLSETWRLATSETGLEASLRTVGSGARRQLERASRAATEAARAESGATDWPGYQCLTRDERIAAFRGLLDSWEVEAVDRR